MLINIISHCWKYSRCLAYQLSSLVLHRPKADVWVEVCCTADDRETNRVIDYFQQRPEFGGVSPNVVRLYQTTEQLLQRSIGRNELSRVHADVTWFTDCDHVFGDGCLDAIPQLEPDTFYWPRTVMRHRTHALGDEAIRGVHGAGLYDVDPADFEPVRMKVGIGGLQIVNGETARARGYCPNSKWQRPLAEGATRFSFGSDVAYRRQFTRHVGLDLPNLYRIRQTTSGEVDTLETQQGGRPRGATAL